MGRMRRGAVKWEKATLFRPPHNVISSDFSKYSPQPWKFMDGEARMDFLLSYEYQRMWLEERETWKKRMYPENLIVNVDVVKGYVLTFKTVHQPPKAEPKKTFKLKKFEGIPSKNKSVREPGDKAWERKLQLKKEAEEKAAKKSDTHHEKK